MDDWEPYGIITGRMPGIIWDFLKSVTLEKVPE